MKAQEILIFNIGHTSQLDVSDNEVVNLGNTEEFKKQEDFIYVDDASSNQTFTEGGPMGSNQDPIGLFRCKSLDLAKLVTSKQHLHSFKKYIYFKYVFLVGGS